MRYFIHCWNYVLNKYIWNHLISYHHLTYVLTYVCLQIKWDIQPAEHLSYCRVSGKITKTYKWCNRHWKKLQITCNREGTVSTHQYISCTGTMTPFLLLHLVTSKTTLSQRLAVILSIFCLSLFEVSSPLKMLQVKKIKMIFRIWQVTLEC